MEVLSLQKASQSKEDAEEGNDADLMAETTPLEDHIAETSPLQKMSQDTRRIDQMPEQAQKTSGRMPL